jgi:hypothetical protein
MGRLKAVSNRTVAFDAAYGADEEESTEVMGPELLDPTFDEIGDIALACDDLLDRVRLHTLDRQRHHEEESW